MKNKLKFLEDGHIYLWNKKRVWSVTQIIGAWLKIKVNGYIGAEFYINTFTGATVNAQVFEAAGRFGTDVHKAVFYHITASEGLDWDKIKEEYPELLPPLWAFLSWEDHFKPKYHMDLIEQPMYSDPKDEDPDGNNYCGTPDIPCTIKRVFTIPDLKTGMFDDAPSQLSAYEKLIRANDGYRGKIVKSVISLPKKKGLFRYIPFTELDYNLHWNFFKTRLFQKKYLERRG